MEGWHYCKTLSFQKGLSQHSTRLAGRALASGKVELSLAFEGLLPGVNLLSLQPKASSNVKSLATGGAVAMVSLVLSFQIGYVSGFPLQVMGDGYWEGATLQFCRLPLVEGIEI